MEEKSKSITLKSLNGLGDTVPETFPSLGEVTISLVDEISNVVISETKGGDEKNSLRILFSTVPYINTCVQILTEHLHAWQVHYTLIEQTPVIEDRPFCTSY